MSYTEKAGIDAIGSGSFIRQIEVGDNTVLDIYQLEVGDVGACVWDAALVLIKYLETKMFWSEDGQHFFKGKRILELGSGTGAVGLAAAVLGGDVILTDLEEFLPLMKHNAEVNSAVLKGTVDVVKLKWGEDVIGIKPSVILVADCLYYDQSVKPLINTLNELSDENTLVIFCYEDRRDQGKDQIQKEFFEHLKTIFSIEQVPSDQLHPEFQSPDIYVLRFIKKNRLLS